MTIFVATVVYYAYVNQKRILKHGRSGVRIVIRVRAKNFGLYDFDLAKIKDYNLCTVFKMI